MKKNIYDMVYKNSKHHKELYSKYKKESIKYLKRDKQFDQLVYLHKIDKYLTKNTKLKSSAKSILLNLYIDGFLNIEWLKLNIKDIDRKYNQLIDTTYDKALSLKLSKEVHSKYVLHYIVKYSDKDIDLFEEYLKKELNFNYYDNMILLFYKDELPDNYAIYRSLYYTYKNSPTNAGVSDHKDFIKKHLELPLEYFTDPLTYYFHQKEPKHRFNTYAKMAKCIGTFSYQDALYYLIYQNLKSTTDTYIPNEDMINLYQKFLVNMKIEYKDIEYAISKKVKYVESVQGWTTAKFYNMVKKMENNINTYIETHSNTYNIEVSKKTVEGYTMTDEQYIATKSIIQNDGFHVINGAAGTGKSMIANTIIANLSKELGRPINVVSYTPTAQAAKVLSTYINQKVSTIDSVIYASIDMMTKTYEEDHTNYDLLLIDETSMIDEGKAGKIFEIFKNPKKIIFMGDVIQLPSIDRGNFLYNLRFNPKIHYHNLTEVKRYGNSILKYATNIRNNNFMPFSSDEISNKEIYNKNQLLRYLYEQDYFKNTSSSKILTFVNGGELGTIKLNSTIQWKLFNNVNVKKIQIKGNRGINYTIHETEEIRFCQNFMSQGLINGDVFKVLKIYNDSMKVLDKYSGEEKIITEDYYQFISLNYVTTVHMAQGSSYDNVYIVGSGATGMEKMLNTPKMLYTSVTRAKKKLHNLMPTFMYKSLAYKDKEVKSFLFIN